MSAITSKADIRPPSPNVRYAMRRRNHLDQYILAFAVEFGREQADAGGVAAGMRERF